jgi:hypothetical protein
LTAPLPVPLLPPVMVIQPTLLLAVQLQLLPVLTPTLPLPPAADMFVPVEGSVKLQTVGVKFATKVRLVLAVKP